MNPPTVTHIGAVAGNPGAAAFTSEEDAAAWAADNPARRRVWPVRQIELGEEHSGRRLPVHYDLVPTADETPAVGS